MKRTRRFLTTTALAAAFGITAGGCGSGITADTTIADALTSLAQNPLLSQITIGDLVQAFNDFMAGAGNEGAALTEDQQSELRTLQGQLDSGSITEAEFEDQAQAIAGLHGHMGGRPSLLGGRFHEGPLTGDLALTEEQQTQAQEIFQAAHDDIAALRQAAQDDIYNNVLTDEQRATLDELRANHQPLMEDEAAGDDSAERVFGRGFGPGGGRGPAFGRRPFRDRLAELLDLTDEQQTQIDEIRAQLREDVQARHEQARDEFRAILTDEQLAALDEFIANHPMPGHDDSDVTDSDNSNE